MSEKLEERLGSPFSCREASLYDLKDEFIAFRTIDRAEMQGAEYETFFALSTVGPGRSGSHSALPYPPIVQGFSELTPFPFFCLAHSTFCGKSIFHHWSFLRKPSFLSLFHPIENPLTSRFSSPSIRYALATTQRSIPDPSSLRRSGSST